MFEKFRANKAAKAAVAAQQQKKRAALEAQNNWQAAQGPHLGLPQMIQSRPQS